MAVKRIIYSLILLAVAVAFVVSNSAVALFLLVSLLALPLISLIMLLIVRKKVRFELSVRESCIRGGTLQLNMRASATPRFFLGGIKVLVEIENTTFDKTEYKSFLINDLSFAPHIFDYNGADSGRICVKCDYLYLVDIFGVFSVKVRQFAYAEAIVSPMLFDDIGITVGDRYSDTIFGDTSLPKKGGDITEVYDVRDYIVGDSPNTVHWKLSGKFGTLKSKEFGATDDRRILILVDLSRVKYENTATDAQLNGVLDVAVSISNALKNTCSTHSVGWFTGGEFESSEVGDSDTFVRAVGKLMSIKVNDGNEETMFYLSRTPECAVFTKIILVSPFVNYEEFGYAVDAEVTAVEVGENSGETIHQGVRVINIPLDNIHDALAACRI
ncbi:MAG: DUF58 domain-containing protein [Clostridiales bacterium]|nr:DUF58 domain-containing protein [Clostridiales bacterium]